MSDNRQSAINKEPDEIAGRMTTVCALCGSIAPMPVEPVEPVLPVITPVQPLTSTSPEPGPDNGAPKTAPSVDGLSKWEHDTFRDILNNANNTLRFQVQLGVPLLAGCITALNIIPPQSHQELLNLMDRWVFIPVLLSMGVAFYGLEMHWQTSKSPDNVETLSKLIKRKYHLVHLAIMLQALGLILLMTFVLLEYK